MLADRPQSTALLIVDVQKGLADPALGERNNPQAEENMAALLDTWRRHGLPRIFIRHCSVEPGSKLRPGLPGNAYRDEVAPRPEETEFTKSANSAFIGTGLETHLREAGIASLVVVGLTTEHCVSSTVRMASDLGFEVCLVADATAAFERNGYDERHYSAEQIHLVNLVSLEHEFCRVCSTAEVLAAVDTELAGALP